jgi:hypothetical protein
VTHMNHEDKCEVIKKSGGEGTERIGGRKRRRRRRKVAMRTNGQAACWDS